MKVIDFKNATKEAKGYFFTSNDIVLPQCGQVILFGRSFSSATSSETDMPMMSAISFNLSNVGLPLMISCDRADCGNPISPFGFFICDATSPSVKPQSLITFLMFIIHILYNYCAKLEKIRIQSNILIKKHNTRTIIINKC